MKQAIGYIRVSTEEQVREGVSLDAQKAKIQAYAILQGITVINILVDAGISASKPLNTRPEGSKLVELIDDRKNNIQAIIAIKLDRLFRNAAECLIRTEQWEKKEIALHLIDQGGASIDTTSSMGRFFLTIMAGVAEMERNMIRERTKSALDHKKAVGEKTGGYEPMGYKTVNVKNGKKRLIEDTEEQKVIQLIYKLKTKKSIRAIAKEMERRGITTANGNTKWHPTTIQRLLAER